MKTIDLPSRLASSEPRLSDSNTLGVVIIPAGVPRKDWPRYIQARAGTLSGSGGLVVIPAKGGRLVH